MMLFGVVIAGTPRLLDGDDWSPDRVIKGPRPKAAGEL
jgi:hypothetical protein